MGFIVQSVFTITFISKVTASEPVTVGAAAFTSVRCRTLPRTHSNECGLMQSDGLNSNKAPFACYPSITFRVPPRLTRNCAETQTLPTLLIGFAIRYSSRDTIHCSFYSHSSSDRVSAYYTVIIINA